MNFNALRYVIKIAEEQNITKAAEKLYVTQSALSQNLRNLEKELDFQIFDRETSPLILTEAGKYFIEWAKRVVYSENEMRHQLLNLSRTQNRVLRIGISPQKSINIFPKVLKNFYEMQPGCKVILEEHPSDVLLDMLEMNEIDILFDVQHSECVEYEFVPIAEERIHIAVPSTMDIKIESKEEDYPVAELSDVMKKPFISLSEKQYLGKVVKHLYELTECIPNIVMECRSAEMALQMVEIGLGVTVVPEFAMKQKEQDGIRYYSLNGSDIRRVVGISCKKGMEQQMDVKKMIELLKTFLNK